MTPYDVMHVYSTEYMSCFFLRLLFGTISGVFGAIIPHVDCGAILIDVLFCTGLGRAVFLGFLGFFGMEFGMENRLAFHLILQSRNVLVFPSCFLGAHSLPSSFIFLSVSALSTGVNVPAPDFSTLTNAASRMIHRVSARIYGQERPISSLQSPIPSPGTHEDHA